MQPERIQRLARDEPLARHTGFWWGLAEGLFFFIVPDVYVSFATLFAPRTGAIAWLFSILGSLVAVCVIYFLVSTLRLDFFGFLEWVPGISDSMMTRVREHLAIGGLPYTPLLALGGVPLKAYAATAFSLGLSLGSVLVWTVFARIVRIAPTFVLAAGIRVLFSRRIDARPAAWLAGLLLSWVAFYLFYFYGLGA